MTAEERVQRAWSKVTFGPGWEDRLSELMEEEIRGAVAEALTERGYTSSLMTNQVVLEETKDDPRL